MNMAKKLVGEVVCAAVALAAGSAAALPSGYEQVAYIQGDGQTGYILTDYVPQPNRDKIVIEFELANLSKNSALWCTRSYVSNPKQAATWEMFHLPGTGFRMDYKTDESANRTIFGNSAAANTRYTLTTAGRKVKWSATGDTEYAAVGSDQTVTCRGPLVLLNSYNLTSADDDTRVMESMYAAHRIYSVKIYRDDELMFDLVPAATPNGVGTLCNLTDNAIQIATKGTVFAAGRDIELHDNVYVDSAASEYTQPPYESPSNACPSFALAVAVVATNGTIHVAGGDATHATKEYQCTSATVSFDNAKPFKVAGPADCTAVFLEPNFVFNAGQVWSGLTFSLGNDPAVSANKRDYGIAYLRSGSVVSNCVFRGGVGTCVRMGDGLLIDSTIKEFAGCGIYCQANSSPMIVNTEVRDSTDNYPASPRTTSVEQGNPIAAVQFGSPCTPVFEHCRIFNNVSKSGYGAGAFSWIAYAGGTRLVLDRCVVSNNTGRSGIARLAMNQSHDNRIYATNCLFVANRSVDVAGSETTFSATPPSALIRGEFVNCTIADNSGADALFALSTSNGNDCKFVNTVISNNRVSMPSGSIMTTFDGGAASVRYSLYPEASGNNNVAGPAVFSRVQTAPYALSPVTAGSRAGDASIWGDGAQDLAGNDRVTVRGSNKYVDMGCYQVDEDYRGARVRGRIFLPEGIYYYPIWDGFDGSTKTTGTTRWSISNQYAIYDVGRPMVMNAFGLLARPGYGARSKNYAWYGTNDKDDVATNGIANATFLFNTGTDITASTDYTNFYPSASSEAFRYYCYAPRGNEELNYHFMFFSEEAQIHQNPVHTLSSDSVGGEEPSTIPFTGTLAYWPHETTPKIRVMVSPVEHEFNYNAWAADAQTRVFESAGTYSQGDNWSVDVANLPQGRWHARAFAVDGERTIAAHTSVAFATGTKPYYPKAYYPTGIGTSAFRTYDSLINAYAEVSGTQRIVFKLDDPRVEIVGFRIWGRTGNDGNWLVRAMNGRLRVTNDEGDMGEVTDYTGVTARSLHYAEKEPEGVTWTDCLRLQELDFYADRTEGYYAEYPVKIPIRNPTYICFDKFTYYQFREIEFRTLPRPTGSVYYIR